MSTREREVRLTVENELENYQVGFKWGEGGKHPFVLIENGVDSRKIAVSFTPSSRSLLNVRADVRRALRDLKAQPWPDRKRQSRISPLGEKLLEAAIPATPIILKKSKRGHQCHLSMDRSQPQLARCA